MAHSKPNLPELEQADPASILRLPWRDLLEGMRPGINGDAFFYYRRLRRMAALFERTPPEDWSLEMAASAAALERSYFSKFFRRKVGICFSDWLTLTRVGISIKMMRASNQSVSEVAFAAGFGDLRTFQRAFKKWVGTTPSGFRRRVRPC